MTEGIIKFETKEQRLMRNDHSTHMQHRRKAIKSKLPCDFTMEQWNVCQAYFESKCAYCGAFTHLTHDHVIPVVSGGDYTIANILPSCGRCNVSKGDRPLLEWYHKQKFYSCQREQAILKYLSLSSSGEEGFKEIKRTAMFNIDNPSSDCFLPEKTTKAKLYSITIHLDEKAKDQIARLSESEGRSVDNYIECIIKREINKEKKQ